MAFVLTSFLFFLTQFLQRVLELDALETGLAFLPFGAALLITARSAPKLLARIDPRWLAVAGFALMAIAMLWLTQLDADSAYASAILAPIVSLGAGAGAAIVPLNMIILSQTPPEDVGITSGVLQAALSVGRSLGLAVLLTLFTGADDVATGVTRAFVGGVVMAALAIVVSVAVWFIRWPARRP
jgi:predicted MFS family arabinose efflux permease